jgi:hypothetical protein
MDETPTAYEPTAPEREAQRDLVEIVRALPQVVCVKG